MFRDICCVSFKAQEIKIPNNFIEVSIPKVESEEWFALAHSNDWYVVKKDCNRLIVEKTIYDKVSSELEIEDGKLIAKIKENGEEHYIFNLKETKKKL